mmetsp:Transcript_53894/g.171110  ORF Transcript_53894/g.171110 Transcript_53894/m.171110 type:complete len:103 (-) Transcript_53894:62-370(-)
MRGSTDSRSFQPSAVDSSSFMAMISRQLDEQIERLDQLDLQRHSLLETISEMKKVQDQEEEELRYHLVRSAPSSPVKGFPPASTGGSVEGLGGSGGVVIGTP